MHENKTTAVRARSRSLSDVGSAMLVVMGAAALLFVIAATVIGIVVFQQTQLTHAQSVERATSLAQQGMDLYMGALREDPDYWMSKPRVAGATKDGTWTVVADVSAGSITAVGHEKTTGQLHVIRAHARPESYSDYTVVTSDTVTLGRQGSGVQILGAVRSNAGVDLVQSFSGMTVMSASASSVVNPDYAGSGVQSVRRIVFPASQNIFPGLFTASRQRASWTTGVSLPQEAADLVKPMVFYRDPSNSTRSYWGVPDESAPSINATDLVGVGIDFANVQPTERSLGIFYVRSMWSPNNIYSNVTAAEKARIGRQEFIDFARQDPTWNTNGWASPELTTRPKSITARALSPRGDNIIYVGGDLDVYVKGEVARSVTIVSENDIYVIGSITRAKDSTATVGLVAKHNIYICSAMPKTPNRATQYETRSGSDSVLSGDPYTRGATGAAGANGKAAGETMPNDVTVQADMMAVRGAIIMDPEQPTGLASDYVTNVGLPVRDKLTIKGSLTAYAGLRGANFVNTASSMAGFASTVITPDEATGTTPPPMFPQTGSGAIVVTRWDEFDSRTDPNVAALSGAGAPDPFSYYRAGITYGGVDTSVVVVPKPADSHPPVTTSDALSSYDGEAIIKLSVADVTDTGAGKVAATYFRVDGSEPETYTGEILIAPAGPNTVITHTVTYWSVDDAGNAETPKTITFEMRGHDTLPPFTTVRDSDNPSKALPNGYPQIGDEPYVVWGDFVPQFTSVESTAGVGTGVNEIWVSMKVNGVPTFANNWAGTQTPLNFAPQAVPAVGSVQLSYEYCAYDKAGNREATRTLTVTQRALDTVAPIVTHDAPSSGLFVGDAVIHLTADDMPDGQGVGSITYKIDDGDWVTVKAKKVAQTMVATVSVPAPTDPDSMPVAHTLQFMATDVATDRYHLPAPNTGSPAGIRFLVGPALQRDTTLPQSSSDAQGSYVGPALINLYSSDPVGIASINWQLDGGAVQSVPTVYVDAPTGDPITHTLTFWAVDNAGNTESPAKSVTFVVSHEIVPPVTFAHNQDLYSASPALFQLTAEDNDGGSGIAATYYSIDGGTPVRDDRAPLNGFTWVSVSGNGQHHVEFWSVDRAGNVEAAKSCDFLIDTQAPVTTTDVKTTTYTGQAVIKMSATDSGSGVAYSHWRNTSDGNEQVSNPILVGPGIWDIDYWSVDKAGNKETPKRLHVEVVAGPDTFAPMSYDDIQPYYKAGSSPAALHLFSWDVQTGVKAMSYRLDGAATQSLPGVGIPPANYLVTATGDGTHTIEYWAADNATPSNVETHQVHSFMIDTVLPVTTCDAVSGSDYWGAKTFSLTASDVGSGLKATYFQLDSGAVVKGTSIYVPSPVNGYARQHTIRYWSEDLAGNVETVHSATITSHLADTIAPTTYSNAKASYFGSSIISLSAFDNVGGSGVGATHFILDSGADTTGTLVLATGSGQHTLEFWSVDNAGNVELPHHFVTYLLDYFGPTTVCDENGKWFNKQPIQVHLNTSALSGKSAPAFTSYRLDGSAVTTGSVPTTITIAGEGAHNLQFWSTDGYGNVESTKTATVGIDLWPPVTTSNAAGAYAGSADFTLTAVDQVGRSGVDTTYWKVSGDTTQTGTQVHVAGPGGYASATKTVTFWSVDRAGNVESPHTVIFTIGPDAGMAFDGMFPDVDTTITTRETTVGCSATTSSSAIVSAIGMLDGVPMPTVFSTTTTTTGGNGPFSVSGGGVVYTSGSNTVIMFRSSGTLSLSAPIAGASILVVGGGGGGGSYTGGGGGAGKVVVQSGVTLATGANAVTVGTGGSGSTGTAVGSTADNALVGQSSVAFGITAAGGQPGKSSAGGTSGQPFGGGATYSIYGAGGGGAAAAGASGVAGVYWAPGGAGLTSSISGSAVTYGKGGDGSYLYNYTSLSAGAANSGNGGTAGSYYYGGAAGGSGVVIVSFPTPTSMVPFASGGTKTTTVINGVSYDVLTFTSTDKLYVSGTIPNAEVLVVGGGGGGAVNLSGGGGAGGVISGRITLSGVMNVAVGGGGGTNVYNDDGCSTWYDPAGDGGASSIGTITALGGGHGGQRDIPDNATTGASGGGGCDAYVGGSTGAAGTAGQGNRGGDGSSASGGAEGAGGGGGGAGSAGKVGIGGAVGTQNGTGGAGGDGVVSTISGASVYYGGGGGGGSYYVGGKGGLGGGGNGEPQATPGASNTGGGGGAGAAGGSGIVIVRYPTPAIGAPVTKTVANASYFARNLLDGAHWASFTFTNALGQSSTKSWRFYVSAGQDVKAPVSSSDVTSTAAYTTGSGSTLTGWYTGGATVHLSAADEPGGTGVAGLSYILDGGATQVGLSPTATVAVSGEGKHTIEFWAQDRAGNIETPHQVVNVAVDTTPPTTKDDAVPTYKGFATISLTATDGAGSGVKSTYYVLDAAGASPGSVSTFTATGGTVSVVGTRTIVTFKSSGSLVCSGTMPGAQVLVVGGGGGGCYGGGGGGGVVTGTTTLSGTMAVAVGGGGSGAYYTGDVCSPVLQSDNGADSSFAGMVAKGGGAGANWYLNGSTGGSGGGGGHGSTTYGGASTQTNSGGGTGYGFAGGGSGGFGSAPYPAGGGGGAGGLGMAPASSTAGGNGGIGFLSSINGTASYFGSGGGGGVAQTGATAGGAAGSAGGGKGAAAGTSGPTAGAANSGGGGGGGSDWYLGAAGGSGVVIISFPTPVKPLLGASVTVPGPLNGPAVSHTLYYWSVDNLGNVETAKSATFQISSDDRTPPQTTCNAAQYYKAPSTITLTATDAGVGVDYTRYRLTKDGVAGAAATGTLVPTGSQGSYKLEFWSVDKAGNVEPTQTVTYVVDQTAPVTSSDAAPNIVVAPITTTVTAAAASQSFACVNDTQLFTVPAGVTTIAVSMQGGQAWDSMHGVHSGDGVNAVINVTPGQQLTLNVGGAGHAFDDGWAGEGGWPDGAVSGTSQASGGGGSTTILMGTSVVAQAAGASAHRQSSTGLTTYAGGGVTQIAGGTGSTSTGGVTGGGSLDVQDGSVTLSWTSSGSQTFGFTGTDQSFTVPPGVSSITVDLYGAQGGDGYQGYVGGAGGHVNATFAVSPGQTYTLRVGGTGGDGPGGWPNGGSAGHGGGGGGSTSIWFGTSERAEAGGGGGGSCDDGDGFPGGAQGYLPGGYQSGGAGQGSGGGGGWNGGAGMVSSHGADPGSGGTSYIASGSGTLDAGVNGGNGWAKVSWSVATGTTTRLEGGSATIHLSASDDHVGSSGVAATYYQLDGGASIAGTTINVQGPTSGSASHSITFWSVDKATNTETSKVATFTIIAEAAQMTWSGETPTPLSIVRVRNPIVAVTGESNEVIVAASATLDGIAMTPPNLTLVDAGSSMKRTAQFSASNLSDGVHTVVFTFQTSSGRQSIHVPWTFVVSGPDVIPPVTKADVKASYQGTATIALSATDASPGVAATFFQLDGGDQVAGTTITVAPPQYGNPVTHNIKYWSVDGFNNTEPKNSATFTVAPTVDTTPPTTTSDLKPEYEGPATIHLTAVDNPGGWGVANSYYRVDGGPKTTYAGSIVVDPPGLGSQGHSLEFWSVDRAGCEESHTIAPFTINSLADFTPPTTTSDCQTYYRTTTAKIQLTATDNRYGSGVDYTLFRQTKNGVAGAWTTGTVIAAGGEGAYTLEFLSVDRAGNRETTRSVSYWVDLTPPVSSTDASSSYTGPATIHITGTDGQYGSGYYQSQYMVDGSGTWVNGNTVTVADPILGSVTHHLDYRSQDRAGNWETSRTVSFRIDAVPADVVFSGWTPAKLSLVNVRNPLVSVRGRASTKVTNVTATLDGSAVSVSRYYNTTDNTDCTAYFNTSNLSDTTHTVSFTYTISSGATKTESWSFAVLGPDNVPPVTTLLDLQPSYEGTATIHMSAVDYFPAGTPSGFYRTYYTLNGTAQQYSTTASTTVVVAPPAYGTVTRTLTYYSVDNANNPETQRTVSFTVTAAKDTTPPTTVTDAVAVYTGSASIKLTASDNAGGWGVDHTEYRVAMTSPTPSNGTTLTSTTAVTSVPTILGPRNGSATYRLYYRSIDRATNAETTKWVDFTVNAATDNTPPVTTISAKSRYNGPGYAITLSATDAGQGVQYTHYILTSGTTQGAETSGTALLTGTQGTYTLQYWSVDWAGNKEATQTFTYVVDQTAPSTTSNQVSTYTVSASITLTARDDHPGFSGVSYTSYQVDGGATKSFVNYGLPTDPFVSSVTVSRWYASGAPEVHSLRYWSTDNVGWPEASKTVTFTITATGDTTPPSTTTDRKPFYGGPSIVQLTAVDAGWGVAFTNWRLDDGAIMTGTLAGTGGSGPHTLYYWSTDNAGNVEAQHSTTFTVDTTAPVTSVVATATTYSGSAAITLTAVDPQAGSGVAATYYRVDGSSQVRGSSIFVAGPQSGSATHTLDFWSVDNVNNTETPQRVTFTVNAVPDNTAPSLLDDHAAAYSKPATITLKATDAGWGVASMRYQLDGGTIVTAYSTGSPGVGTASCLVGTGGGTPSPHTLKYWATDQAGNTATSMIVYTVAPDTTPPVTMSNAQSLYANGPAQILLTATDAGWGVKFTHYRLNGGVETSGTFITVPDPLVGSTDATLTYWSEDWAGNTESAHTATFTVKAVPSVMTFSNITPADGSTVGTTTTSVGITATSNLAISSAVFKVDATTSSPTTFTASGVTATAALKVTGLTEGTHTVTATFTTSDGRQNSKTWIVVCHPRTDYMAPVTVADVRPSYWGTATITLTPSDETSGSGVDYTRYQVDGGQWTTGTLPSTRIVIAAPASGSPESHKIQFWSADKAGNVENALVINFKVGPLDVTPPVTGSNAAKYYRSPGTILLLPTDTDGSGVAATYYLLDGDSTATNSTMVGTGGAGSHTLTFWSVDNAGNEEAPTVITYVVDELAPTTRSDVAQEYSGDATIHLIPEDQGGSGVYQTYYDLDGGGQVTGKTLTVPAPVSDQQQHTLRFWSIDNAGNVEDAQTVSFYVKALPDTIPPVTSIDYKSVYAVPGLITLSAVDNSGGWGVASTHYVLDSSDEAIGLKVRTGGAGTHTLKYWSVDKGGNYEQVKSVTYTVLGDDITPPVTSADATDGARFVGAAKISLTATDNCGAPSVTYYQLDGDSPVTGTVVNVPGPMSDSATHTLTFWSVDFNGVVEDKTASRNTIHFTCNKYSTDMTFSGITPTDKSKVGIRNPVITVIASGTTTMAGAAVTIDGAAYTSSVSLSGKVATLTCQADHLLSGTVHTVVATFMDVTGGVAAKTWTFTVDAPPDTTIPVSSTDAGSVYRGPVAIHIFSTDEVGGSGVAQTYYRLDGGAQVPGTPPTTTVSVSAEGPHWIEYWAVDVSGNTELPHHQVGFNIDQTAPKTASDAALAYDGPATINLTPDDGASGSGVAGTHFIVDAGAEQSGTVITVPAPSAGSQWHVASFWSVDRAGNVETSQSVMFNVWAPDTTSSGLTMGVMRVASLTPPKTTSDAQATYASTSIIRLTASGTMPGQVVAHTYYSLDGGAPVESTVLGTGAAGTHTLRFWSVDGTGLTEAPNTVSYAVASTDRMAPTTTSDVQKTYSGVGQVHLMAADGPDGTGVAHTYYRLDGGPQVESTLIGVAGVGTHQLVYWSADWAGNVEAPVVVQFDIVEPDLVAPVTTSDTLTSYVGTATIALTATDEQGGSGVRSTYYRLDSGPAQEGVQVRIAPPAAGTARHNLVFWSVDKAGNAEGVLSVDFDVAAIPDLLAPVTTSDAVPSYAGTATIALSASDGVGGSGVASTYYSIDGGPRQQGVTVVVPAPAAGEVAHQVTFWSVDRAGNAEAAQRRDFVVVPAGPLAYLSFSWTGSGTETMHVENAAGLVIASATRTVAAGAAGWRVPVPAGASYRTVCDSWQDTATGRSGSGSSNSPVMAEGQVYTFTY